MPGGTQMRPSTHSGMIAVIAIVAGIAGCSGPDDSTTQPCAGGYERRDDGNCYPSADTGDSQDTGDTGEPADSCGDAGPPELSDSSWTEAAKVPGGGILSLVQGPGGVPMYAGSLNSGLWSSDDRGESWMRQLVQGTHTLADLAVSPDDPEVIYRSEGGVLKRSETGGSPWTTLPLGYVTPEGAASVFALAVTPHDASRVYGVLDSGQTYVSTDAGDTFTEMGQLAVMLMTGGLDPYNSHAWTLLPEASPGGRVSFTDGESFYTSDDGLATWQSRFTSALGGHSLRRNPTNPDHLLIGANDGLLESFDEGDTWTLRDVGAGIALAAWAEDGSWLAVASADTLYVSEDGGATFIGRPFDWIETNALAIVGAGADGRLVMSWDNGVVVSDDRGQTWTDSSTGLVDPGMSVAAPHPLCPNRVYVASRCSGGVYASDDYGTSWTHVDRYFHYVMGIHYDPSDPSTVWAVSDDRLDVSRDGGASWEISWMIYHFHGFAIDPGDSQTLLLGSVGSGNWADTSMRVYASTDGGETWVDSSDGLPTSTASAHTIAYWPGNSDVVLLGTYKGEDPSHFSGDGEGAFLSTDGGATWTAAALPAVNIAWVSPCPGGMVATTEDGLYRSLDEGVSWQRLDGPEGFLLSADFHGDLGLVLGQDGRVWRTDDGGDTWRQLDDGLSANPTSFLAQIAIGADGSTAWATVFEQGVYRIGLTD